MDLMSVKGIVIRQTLWGEQGKFVDIFTENGIKTIRTSTKIKNASVTEMLAYSEFILQPSKDCFYIKEADPIRMFYGLRSDLDKLNLAYYFAKIVRESGESETIRLLLNSLHLLEKSNKPLPLLRSIFQIRLLTEIGYTPLLVSGLEKVIEYIETAPIERLWKFHTGNMEKLSEYAEYCMENLS
jgi:DNA repair protein RecO (recombination protein O)